MLWLALMWIERIERRLQKRVFKDDLPGLKKEEVKNEVEYDRSEYYK